MAHPRAGFRLPGPLEWIYLAAGLVLVHRYRWILDDALVYWRYVDNLLFLDRGLVFNQGEYVEGYSSPLWLLLLIGLRATRLDYWLLTEAVAVASFVAFWALLVRLNRSLSPEGPAVNFPLAFLALSYGVTAYFTSGVETPLVQVTGVVYALFVLNPASVPLQLALAVSPLVRHEFALPFAICAAWSWHRRGAIPWRMLGAATLLVTAWLVFRVVYYADLLPNTFYLKNDVWIRQGLVYAHQTASTYYLYVGLGLFGAAALWLRRKGTAAFEARWTERAVMLACALSVAAYVVKIGGDPRHHRYLAFPFVLAVCSLAGIAEALLRNLGARARRWTAPVLSLVVAGISFAAVPPQLDRHPVSRREKQVEVHHIMDASWHRHHDALTYDAPRRREDRERLARYRTSAGLRSRGYGTCIVCFPAYLDIDRKYIQSYGLTDAILARTDAAQDRPAHKFSLLARARDLARLLGAADAVDAGVYRRLTDAGEAPPWIEENLASIEIVARKVYNRHRFGENLALAFRFPERIHVPDWREEEGEE